MISERWRIARTTEERIFFDLGKLTARLRIISSTNRRATAQ